MRAGAATVEERSSAKRADGSLKIAAVYDTRHAPAVVRIDRTPEDAKLANTQASPWHSSFQCPIVCVGRQWLLAEHVSHRSQRRALVVGMELAQIALRLAVELDRDLRHGA